MVTDGYNWSQMEGDGQGEEWHSIKLASWIISNVSMEQKVYPWTISRSGLEGKATFGMLWWEFVTSNALKSMKVMKRKTLYNTKKKPPGHRSSSSQQTSAILTPSLCTCSRRFLDSVGGNFLVQLLERQISQGEDFSLLELLLNSSKALVRNLIREDTLSCGNHRMITDRTERRGGKTNIRDKTQDFRKANSICYKELPGIVSWKITIQGKTSRTAIDFYGKFVFSSGTKHLTV